MQTGLHTECCMSVGDSKYFRRESPGNIFFLIYLIFFECADRKRLNYGLGYEPEFVIVGGKV